MNGMARHGGVRPFGGTFLIFSDYMRPTMRLAALMEAPVIYVFTHDSIGLGEDGPTHQPIEQLMSMRVVPNLTTIRPADARETTGAWQAAIANHAWPNGAGLFAAIGPDTAQFDSRRYAARSLCRGRGRDQGGGPDVILIGTGTEVHLALQAQELLAADGIAARVVSMPSWELFDRQTEALSPGSPPTAGQSARID